MYASNHFPDCSIQCDGGVGGEGTSGSMGCVTYFSWHVQTLLPLISASIVFIQWKFLFAEKFRLRRNWLKGYCTVRTFEGHTQGQFAYQITYIRIHIL